MCPSIFIKLCSLFSDKPDSETAIFETDIRISRRDERLQEQREALQLAQEMSSSAADYALSNTHYLLKMAGELGDKLYMECTPEEKQYYDEHIRISRQDAMKLNEDTVGHEMLFGKKRDLEK